MALCTIFRSGNIAETYLSLPWGQAFEDLPPELRESFGEPSFVMTLDLSKKRQLARADVVQVLEQFEKQGFYLQLPPEIPVEDEITRRLSGRENSGEE